MMIAEAPQPSGGFVLLILLLVLAVVAVHVVVVTLGCLWAWRAARGSRMATAGLLVVGALEALYLGFAFPTLLRGEPNYYLGWVAVPAALQAALYAGARLTRSPGP